MVDATGDGLARGTARVVPYDADWPHAFASESDRIRAAIAPDLPIEHVGSTAVPGLAAKPILDLLVGFRDAAEFELCRRALVELGYEYKGNPFTRDDHIFMLTEGGLIHTHKVHLSAHGGDEWKRKLAFRDHLIARPTTAGAYGQLKQKLARRFANDRGEYTRHKNNFIRNVLRETDG